MLTVATIDGSHTHALVVWLEPDLESRTVCMEKRERKPAPSCGYAVLRKIPLRRSHLFVRSIIIYVVAGVYRVHAHILIIYIIYVLRKIFCTRLVHRSLFLLHINA